MLDLIKRIIIFAIGTYIIIFIGKTLFGDFSLTRFSKDISGAAKEIQSIGKLGQASTSTKRVTDATNPSFNRFDNDNTSSTNPIVTTKGFENSINLRNLSRGNMVSPGQTIEGSAPSSWFYENVSMARFYNEQGGLLGNAQMRATGDTSVAGSVPFTVIAQFTQGYAQTGYVVFEKANVGATVAGAARYAFPITYPVRNSGANTGSTNTGQATNNDNQLAPPVVGTR